MTGRNESQPTWSVTKTVSAPTLRTRSRNSGVKWSPAVGRGHASIDSAIHGLVALVVLQRRVDVRRQRNDPDVVQVVRGEPHHTGPVGLYPDHLAGDVVSPTSVGHLEDRPRSHPLPRPDQRPPRAIGQPSKQQQLDPGAGPVSGPVQPRRQDTAVVEGEDVALSEEVRQVVEAAVGYGAVGTENDHQPGVIAGFYRSLGDQVAGEVVVEVGGLHPFRRTRDRVARIFGWWPVSAPSLILPRRGRRQIFRSPLGAG